MTDLTKEGIRYLLYLLQIETHKENYYECERIKDEICRRCS